MKQPGSPIIFLSLIESADAVQVFGPFAQGLPLRAHRAKEAAHGGHLALAAHKLVRLLPGPALDPQKKKGRKEGRKEGSKEEK